MRPREAYNPVYPPTQFWDNHTLNQVPDPCLLKMARMGTGAVPWLSEDVRSPGCECWATLSSALEHMPSGSPGTHPPIPAF